MQKIEMVDLSVQHSRLRSEIDNAISEVIQNGAFINGPQVKAFEQALGNYLGDAQVIGCANGTDALQIAFMALELPQGAEVITPSFSYAALSEVLHLLKLQPVFVEVDPNTFLIDPEKIEEKITDKTVAIAPVHLYGQCANMEAIMNIAIKHSLFVVEDTAQAIGATYINPKGQIQKAGLIGHIGTTSFFPSKNLGGMGDGGALFTKDETLAQKIRMIANHGQSQKYRHEIIGVNSRLDTLQAAILSVKLKHLPAFEAARQQVAAAYDDAFSTLGWIKTPSRTGHGSHVFHQYTITLPSEEIRNLLKAHLANHGVPSMIYYPTPLHQQVAYQQPIQMPLTEALCKKVLSLPMGTEMTQEQVDYIISVVAQFNPQSSSNA